MKKKTLAALLAVTSLVVPSAASAIERQHHVGVGGQLATLVIDDKSTASVGGGLALHYTYGINDTFNLMVEATSSSVAREQFQDTPETPRTRPAGIDHGAFGVGYVIDILQWVPYLCVLGGTYRVYGGTLPEDLYLPGLSFGAGLDYQLSRSIAIGAGVREHLMISKLQTYPTYTTLFLRAEYMWGW
jgi:opacity protein-like surface antigen